MAAFDYHRGSVTVPQINGKNELRGHVVAPVGAKGKRPVVVFLHGFFDTCADSTTKEPVFDYPCPAGSKEVPNYQGFDYVQRHLAAQGFVTVSVDANAVTANDQELVDKGATARSVVVRANLRELAQNPAALGDLPELDMNRVMLVGHSRGGEGVNRTALDSTAEDPWRIAAIASVAPTNFERLGNPTIPGVAFLPTCDGDVSDLEGQIYTDAAARHGNGSALHTSFVVTGGVHNFFNTQWTPGAPVAKGSDDGERVSCPASTRISAEQHHDVLNTYLSVAARGFLEQDRDSLAVLNGTARATGAGTDLVTTVPVGGERTFLMNGLAATSTKDMPNNRPGGKASWCTPAECRTAELREAAPHWLDNDPRDGVALRMALKKGENGSVTFAPRTLRASDAIEGRIVVRGPASAHVKAELLDSHGKPIDLGKGGEIHLTRPGIDDVNDHPPPIRDRKCETSPNTGAPPFPRKRPALR